MISAHKKLLPPQKAAFLLALMDRWPHSWAGDDEDVPVGASLVSELRPFINHLLALGLTYKTTRRHLDNLWAIGGEIIRDVNNEPKLRKTPARKLILTAIAGGEAPLLRNADESEQRSCDATAKRLLRFLDEQ